MTGTRKLHLICNAHIDPVWLWEWPEGVAETISTFRVAAEMCEQFDGFVFNHNEVLLYQWVEEYEPALFERIQRLVKKGRWNIMGGWYLQPDCNIPSGESFVRQILLGRHYFWEKFGILPKTAINFDPFGHSRGLVQILARSGYDSYLFCRPNQSDCPLPAEDFEWVGFDGSTVTGHRSLEFYNSPLGGASRKVEKYLYEEPPLTTSPVKVILWGVGNHGGGPSRQDLENLQILIEQSRLNGQIEIVHSTPEAYFENLRRVGVALPPFRAALNAWAVGCYTSQIEVKQRHRQLENELFLTEKLLSQAVIQGLIKYPAAELQTVMQDLAFAQFHDILPGTSIQPVETTALRLLDHGLEILSRLKTKAFFALASGQPKAEEATIPILIYNPHPYPVEGIFECEFQLADQNWQEEFTYPHLYQDKREVPCQTEQELSNLNLDWRKRIAFRAQLLPSQMSRFDCHLEVLPARPKPHLPVKDGHIVFKTNELEVLINCQSGLIDRYRVNGIDTLKAGSFLPMVMVDSDDTWEMSEKSFRQVAGVFELMDSEAGSRFSGVKGLLESVRVIEDGPVRSVIEAVFAYQHSAICQRYKLPKSGTELEIELTVLWNEKSRMLKLAVPTIFDSSQKSFLGQVAYGVEELAQDGREVVAHKWVGLFDRQNSGYALTCINDGTYGLDCKEGEIRFSLLRSAGYSAHPILERPILPQDRFSGRIDQGERHFRFWFNAGPSEERLNRIDREALSHNEKPFGLSFFPAGEKGKLPQSILILEDEVIQLGAFKQSHANDKDFIVRLFEPTGQVRSTVLKSEYLGIEQRLEFRPFEIKTLRISGQTVSEASLVEMAVLEKLPSSLKGV